MVQDVAARGKGTHLKLGAKGLLSVVSSIAQAQSREAIFS